MTARILVIVVALGLAGLTAYLMQNYLIGNSGTAEAPANTTLATKVLVADKDLPAGTILNSGHWRWQSWPADAVDKTYEVERGDFEAEAAYGGAAVRRAIGAGEPITKARVFRQGDKGFLAGALSPGKRAVGIQISAVSSAAGFIRPGDRVDVILTQQLRRRAADADAPQIKGVSETILSNIRVLAIDQIVDDVNKEAKVGKTATVEVSPKEAEVVTLAARMGRLSLSLSLRSLADTTGLDDRTGMTSDLEISRALVGGKRSPPKRRLRRILVAEHDLPAGALLRDTDLRWAKPNPADTTQDRYLEGRDLRSTLRGALVGRSVVAGQPLASDAVVTPGTPGFITAALAPGRRAIMLGRKAVAGIAGFAAPGDNVDVVLTRRLEASATTTSGHASETIMQNLRILALDAKGGTTALEVTPKQAAALAVVGKIGEISLSLGSGTKQAALSGAPALGEYEISPALAALLAPKAAPKPPSAAAAPPAPRVLVARRSLAKGTLLRDADLVWAPSPGSSSLDALFTEGRDHRADLSGWLVNRPVAAGQPVGPASVIKPGSPGFLSAALSPGARAVILGKSAIAGIGAFAAPGDEVDVVLTQRVARKSADGSSVTRHSSKTVLQRLRILALDAKLGTAAFEVSARQAAELAVVQKMGDISLVLRSGEASPSGSGVASARDFEIDPSLISAPTTKPEPTSETATPRVLFALRDISRGALLRDSDVDWRPAAVVDGTAVFIEGRDKLTALRGALAKRAIAADTPLITSAIIKPGTPGFLAAALTPGLRAISIGVDAVSGVSGFVAPDDRVDIILTQEIKTQTNGGAERTLSPRRFSETVLRSIRVLAIEQSLDPETGQPVAGRTATIEVSSKDVEVVALAATMGRLSLSLGVRPVGSETDTPGDAFTCDLGISAAASDFIARGQRSMAPPPPPRSKKAAPRRPSKVGVKLYRGAAVTNLKFAR